MRKGLWIIEFKEQGSHYTEAFVHPTYHPDTAKNEAQRYLKKEGISFDEITNVRKVPAAWDANGNQYIIGIMEA